MLKKVFYKKSNDFPKRHTRNLCTSAPILVSDASIADLTRHFKKCAPSKSSTSSSCSRRDSPRCLKKLTAGRCVHIQTQDWKDKVGCVEELYFNDEAKRSSASSPRGQCMKPVCPGKREMKTGCSSMTKIEKEMVNRSCGRNVRDSGGTCSLDSASATCDATERAQYYHNKLLSAEQILRNKEETIRVQAESLTVAEARISALSDRANDLKRELDRKTKEYQSFLKTADFCKPQKNDVSIITDKKIKMGELRSKICELECTLANKQSTDMQYKAEIEAKEKELQSVREQLLALEEGSRGQTSTCEALSTQLRHVKALLEEKTTEAGLVQQQNDSQAKTIKDLQEQLEKADQLIKENCKMRSEVQYLTNQVSLWGAQLGDSERRVHALEAELARTRSDCAQLNACYRKKASVVTQLQESLEEAHTRGIAVSNEARHAVVAVRQWMRDLRDKLREKDNLIKAKDELLTALQRRLEERQSDSQRTSVSENTPSCSKCLSSRDDRSFCSKMTERREQSLAPSTTERPSCSTAPVPLRVLKKKPCTNKRCKAWMCDAAMQEPVRRDAGNDMPPFCGHRDVRPLRVRLDRLDRPPRDVSPTEELLLRVEQLSEALADGHRRWARAHDER